MENGTLQLMSNAATVGGAGGDSKQDDGVFCQKWLAVARQRNRQALTCVSVPCTGCMTMIQLQSF